MPTVTLPPPPSVPPGSIDAADRRPRMSSGWPRCPAGRCLRAQAAGRDRGPARGRGLVVAGRRLADQEAARDDEGERPGAQQRQGRGRAPRGGVRGPRRPRGCRARRGSGGAGGGAVGRDGRTCRGADAGAGRRGAGAGRAPAGAGAAGAGGSGTAGRADSAVTLRECRTGARPPRSARSPTLGAPGSFAIARPITSSSPGGSPGRLRGPRRRLGHVRVQDRASTARGNGTVPVRHS